MASFYTFLVTTCLMLLIMANIGEGGSVGINFGRQASQKLLPSMVVDMCLANGISKVKLFSVNEGVMKAFLGTDMELIVAIPNIELVELTGVDKERKMKDWMDKYIKKYLKNEDTKLNIRYICVGVEPFSNIDRDWRNDGADYPKRVVSVLNQIDKIIDGDVNLKGKLKLGVPMAVDILESGSKPSEGDFNKDLKIDIINILKVLDKQDAPFMINIYPYNIVTDEKLPLEFGLFDKWSNHTVIDGSLVYTNVFDVKYDTLVWALRKNGYGHLKIMVTQVGWPTDGGLGANVENAKRFYDGLLKKMASKQGTPLVPEADLDVYLYVLSDENQRSTKRGPFERHYGIYDADGNSKFNIDFTLQGRDVKPESARGVSYLPRRWCILDKEAAESKPDEVKQQYNMSCDVGDCTALANGSSCSFLEDYDKVSYAFNNLFQMRNQEVLGNADCDYNGLGKITNEKPTFAGCDFPVQILSTLFVNGMSTTEMIATLGTDIDFAGERLLSSYSLILIIPLFWIVGIWL